MTSEPALPRQLPLDLPSRPALGREALFVAPCNAEAVARIDAWHDWPGRKLMLVGPPGSGKTHLVHAWAAAAEAKILPARRLAAADLPSLASQNVAVEDAADLAGEPDGERALLHLWNLSLADGGTVLLTAGTPPQEWGVVLPDLLSRLQAAPLVRIAAPDDATLRAVLVKLFADRQLAPTPALVDFIVARMERSFASARDVVARLDAAALSERRPVTRTLAARLLGTGETDATPASPPEGSVSAQ